MSNGQALEQMIVLHTEALKKNEEIDRGRKGVKQITALMEAMVKICEAIDLVGELEDRDLNLRIEASISTWERFSGPTLTSKINEIAEENGISEDALRNMYEDITAGDCGDWVY